MNLMPLLSKHPKCELDHPYVVRINKSTKEKFWGCVFYPEHISTISIPYCSNNHPMNKKESQFGEYFTCRNESCSSLTYDFEPKSSKYHAQLINLFFRSTTSYKEFQITETFSGEDNIDADDRGWESWSEKRKREIQEALEKIKQIEREENLNKYGVSETNQERIDRVLLEYEISYKQILSNANSELVEAFNNLWNNPSQRSRFVDIEPENLISFLEIIKPRTKGLNKFMPWNRQY